MATQTTALTGKPATKGSSTTSPVAAHKTPLSDRLVAWTKAHKQITSWIGAIVVIAAVLFVWTMSTQRRSEEIASRDLQGARFAFENQNLPLAASELAKVIENYSSTNAAAEARLLLANVRLLQNQPQQALGVLKDYAGGAGKAYRAQAFGLLGAAYENMGRFREAGEAYENGSGAARLDFLKAQLLSDAGRAWTIAGDTTRAVADYRRIVKDFAKEAMAGEARVRLGELTKGTVS
ncbi:MAG TPA: tetratricopeptide repeat protein [Gemmatimonadales bacterium]